MSKNGKENQSFKSFDVLAVILLAFLGLVFYSFPFNHQNEGQNTKSARSKAEVLGYQIAQIYKDQVLNSNTSNSRGPASTKEDFKREGVIGSDLNGKPFKYKIIDENQKQLKVIVTNKADFGEEINTEVAVNGTPNTEVNTQEQAKELVYVELLVPLEKKE